MQNDVIYPKLLMFGEYSVLLNGSALSFPLKRFHAKFNFCKKNLNNIQAADSNINLTAFLTFLSNDESLKSHISVDVLNDDLNKGLYLWSDIPVGYGIGSSGVLCAAIYKKYKIENDNIQNGDLINLKKLFISMESYFHGKSSGLDPLTSYLNSAVLMKNSTVLPIQNVIPNIENWALIDSKTARRTDILVKKFLLKCEDAGFLNEFTTNYIPEVEKVIKILTEGFNNILYDEVILQLLISISRMQYEYFEDMIPDNIKDIWKYGLDTSLYYMKLLGAGGGGYFLCYSNNWKEASSVFIKNGLEIEMLKL